MLSSEEAARLSNAPLSLKYKGGAECRLWCGITRLEIISLKGFRSASWVLRRPTTKVAEGESEPIYHIGRNC